MEQPAGLHLISATMRAQILFEALHEPLTTPAKVDPANVLPAELLEMVLLHLSLQDLIRVQGVSRPWRDAFNGSSKIQQALFLHPYPGVVVKAFRDPRCTWKWKWKKQNGEELGHRPLLNPFMERSGGPSL